MPTKRLTVTKAKPESKKIPSWATDHFRESLNSLELLMQLIHISSKGIGTLRGIPKIVKVLADYKGKSDDPQAEKDMERAEKEAALATNEVEKDFPVLHGLAVVALWSWMEHFVKGFLVLWLMNRRDAMSAPAVQKLRVKLGDYLQLRKEEQAYFLIELLEQDLASPLKRGVTRFESLLTPFDLSFALPTGTDKLLFELQQIRNAIAHRNSQADRRLRADCPWLKLKLNEPVRVSRKMLRTYSAAASEFLLAFLYRVGDVYEINLRSEEPAAPNPSIERTSPGKPSAASNLKH
jgi:hypothetical protein